MSAWAFASHGEPTDVLEVMDLPVPAPAAGQVLVAVDAAAVNFSDALIIRGDYQSSPMLPSVAGMELSGTVAHSAEGTPWAPGTRVAGLGHQLSGAFAEYAIMDSDSVFEPPMRFSSAEAASFPVAYQTAWFAVHVRGQLASGEAVVVHAAAGGVGLAAVQLAAAAGARVVGIVGSETKIAPAMQAGCSAVFVRERPDLIDSVRRATGGGADVVIDPVGGSLYAASERMVRFGGRIVLVGFASGKHPVVRPDLVLVKNFSVVGLHWGLYRRHRPDIVATQLDLLRQCVSAASISPLVSRVYDFEAAPDALNDVLSGGSVGRVVLAVGLRSGRDGTPPGHE
ncbi:zinc-binding dehydrogenase (plasmid) [Rhodococcus erythropolis]|uniref:zinc-binding dehydrogenase n=1 Tax=Rhodococcus erythropolis TaxID=1833 RepID=UPI00406BCD3D